MRILAQHPKARFAILYVGFLGPLIAALTRATLYGVVSQPAPALPPLQLTFVPIAVISAACKCAVRLHE